MLYMILLILIYFSYAQKIYVVEREREALSVIDNDKFKGRIENLGNLNHATLKFKGDFAYLISRDGFIAKIDTVKDKLLSKVKIGDSAIGFTFCGDKVVIANYEPGSVVFLSKDLKILREIKTLSRNVGIKSYKDRVIFSLMDKDQIWVINCKTFVRERILGNVGKMPFDALLTDSRYLAGFFGESSVGILNLNTMEYKKISFRKEGEEVVFKIPHFGTWGIYKNTAYIPAVGERKIHLVDLKSFEYKGNFKLPGLPVFVAISPDGKYIAVNFSGDREDFLTLMERESGKVIKNLRLGKRILHFRFTKDSKFLYLSSYYENKLKKVSLPELKVIKEFKVPTPSGVFIKEG